MWGILCYSYSDPSAERSDINVVWSDTITRNITDFKSSARGDASSAFNRLNIEQLGHENEANRVESEAVLCFIEKIVLIASTNGKTTMSFGSWGFQTHRLT